MIFARNVLHSMWHNIEHTQCSQPLETHRQPTRTNCAATKWTKQIILPFIQTILHAVKTYGIGHGARVSWKRLNSIWTTIIALFCFVDCFDCNPETIPATGNITELCPRKRTVLELLDSTSIAQNCFVETKGDVCKDCANRFDAVMAKYKVEESTTDGNLCYDVKDAVNLHDFQLILFWN